MSKISWDSYHEDWTNFEIVDGLPGDKTVGTKSRKNYRCAPSWPLKNFGIWIIRRYSARISSKSLKVCYSPLPCRWRWAGEPQMLWGRIWIVQDHPVAIDITVSRSLALAAGWGCPPLRVHPPTPRTHSFPVIKLRGWMDRGVVWRHAVWCSTVT